MLLHFEGFFYLFVKYKDSPCTGEAEGFVAEAVQYLHKAVSQGENTNIKIVSK